MTDLERFGRNVFQLRRNMKMSRRELADLSGVSQSTIDGFECGRRHPTLYSAIQIAKALGTDVTDLLKE